jgi:hypothetical protein
VLFIEASEPASEIQVITEEASAVNSPSPPISRDKAKLPRKELVKSPSPLAADLNDAAPSVLRGPTDSNSAGGDLIELDIAAGKSNKQL